MYKAMYLILHRAVSSTVDIMIAALQQAEEYYITNSNDDALTLT